MLYYFCFDLGVLLFFWKSVMTTQATAVCLMTWFAVHACTAQGSVQLQDASVPTYNVVGVETRLPLVTATLAPEAACNTSYQNAYQHRDMRRRRRSGRC